MDMQFMKPVIVNGIKYENPSEKSKSTGKVGQNKISPKPAQNTPRVESKAALLSSVNQTYASRDNVANRRNLGPQNSVSNGQIVSNSNQPNGYQVTAGKKKVLDSNKKEPPSYLSNYRNVSHRKVIHAQEYSTINKTRTKPKEIAKTHSHFSKPPYVVPSRQETYTKGSPKYRDTQQPAVTHEPHASAPLMDEQKLYSKEKQFHESVIDTESILSEDSVIWTETDTDRQPRTKAPPRLSNPQKHQSPMRTNRDKQKILQKSNHKVQHVKEIIQDEVDKLGLTDRSPSKNQGVTINLYVGNDGTKATARLEPSESAKDLVGDTSPTSNILSVSQTSFQGQQLSPPQGQGIQPRDHPLTQAQVQGHMTSPLTQFTPHGVVGERPKQGQGLASPEEVEYGSSVSSLKTPDSDLSAYAQVIQNPNQETDQRQSNQHHEMTSQTSVRSQTPDHLKMLSAKHVLATLPPKHKGGLQSGESQVFAENRTANRQWEDIPRAVNNESRGESQLSSHTSLVSGTVQYLLKNRSGQRHASVATHGPKRLKYQSRDTGSVSSLDTLTGRRRTQRVRETQVQTDLDYNASDFEDEIKDMGTQTSKNEDKSRKVEEKHITPTQNSKSNSISATAIASGKVTIATNTEDEDANQKGVQTDTDSLLTKNTEVSSGNISTGTDTHDLISYSERDHENLFHSNHDKRPSNDNDVLYQRIRDMILEDQARRDASESHRTLSTHGDSGYQGNDTLSNDAESLFNEELTYVMYLQTEDGRRIGPLMLELDDVHLGLPLPEGGYGDYTSTTQGLRNRATGANSVNEHSSRSHSMLTLHLDSDHQDPEDENLYITKHGKLTFVDLAGSEKTKTDGKSDQSHLVESNNINRSLLVLGNCISSLSDAKKRGGHIPYRDSKLTKLLADSLGGNGVTLMIACVSPSGYNGAESMNTLRYANRAKKIKSKPVVKMDPREKLIMSLKREVKVLRQENHYLRQQLEFPVKPKGQLQKENDEKFLRMLREHGLASAGSDGGLYEMLQEYMIENEILRNENSDLHQSRDQGRREQQALARENERLVRQMENVHHGQMVGGTHRSMDGTPMSMYSMNSTSRKSSADPRQDFYGSPGGTPPSYRQPQPMATQRGGAHGVVNGFSSSPRMPRHQKRPPHRLSEPLNKNNPAFVDTTPRNGTTNHHYDYQQPPLPAQQPMPGGPPGGPPGPQSPQKASRVPQPQVSPGQVPSPRKQRGPPPTQGPFKNASQPPPPPVSSYQYQPSPASESTQQMNERLRQELLSIEGEIRDQSMLNSPQVSSRWENR